jgi:DNA adenine methylase
MLIHRLGNKTKLAQKIYPLFTSHEIYIELFLGAGGMFFNKPKAKYNILNDLDKEIYHTFKIVMERPDELIDYMKSLPICATTFDELSKMRGDSIEDPIWRAGRFLLLANFSLYSTGNTLRIGASNAKPITLDNIKTTWQALLEGNVTFMNRDFRKAISCVSVRDHNAHKVFIYADPPYLDTSDGLYDVPESWIEKDSIELFEALTESGYNFAISEFDHPKILELAEKFKCHVTIIGERQSIKKRNTEILVTNYVPNRTPTLF